MNRRTELATYLSLPFIMLIAAPILNSKPSVHTDLIPNQYWISDRIVVDLNLYTPDARYPLFLLWDYVRSGGFRHANDWERHNEFLEGRLENKMHYNVAEVQSLLHKQGHRIRVGDGKKLWWQTTTPLEEEGMD